MDLWSKISALVGSLISSLNTLDMSVFFSDFANHNVSFGVYLCAIGCGSVLVDALLWGIGSANKRGDKS